MPQRYPDATIFGILIPITFFTAYIFYKSFIQITQEGVGNGYFDLGFVYLTVAILTLIISTTGVMLWKKWAAILTIIYFVTYPPINFLLYYNNPDYNLNILYFMFLPLIILSLRFKKLWGNFN